MDALDYVGLSDQPVEVVFLGFLKVIEFKHRLSELPVYLFDHVVVLYLAQIRLPALATLKLPNPRAQPFNVLNFKVL